MYQHQFSDVEYGEDPKQMETDFLVLSNGELSSYTPTTGIDNLYHGWMVQSLQLPSFDAMVHTPSLPLSDEKLPAQLVAAQSLQNIDATSVGHQPQIPAHHYSPFRNRYLDQLDQMDGYCGGNVFPTQLQLKTPEQSLDDSLQSPQSSLFEQIYKIPSPITQSEEHDFRYRVSVNTPTAMIKNADDSPVTYLNKGQTYSISITDTAPPPGLEGPTRYRTTIHISFDDEHRRTNPGACWQLWKQRRGNSEIQHQGVNPQAVQFVDVAQSRSPGTGEPPTVELETTFIDGFSVLWSPASAGSAEYTMAARFNFLSTDFNQSRGMKGIPLRLCASTKMLRSHSIVSSESLEPEICYCKVKILRDHGAERKLSHDIDHVKRAIGKLKRKITQSGGESDEEDGRDNWSFLPTSATARPGKIPKSNNMSPTPSITTRNKTSAQKELRQNLKSLQDMFTSTSQHTTLDLKGDDSDEHDPNLTLSNGDSQMSHSFDAIDIAGERKPSLHNGDTALDSGQSSSYSSSAVNVTPGEWGTLQGLRMFLPPNFPANPPRHPSTNDGNGGNLSSMMEAAQIDGRYQPQRSTQGRPIACVYVLPMVAGTPPSDGCYRAVYLAQRTRQCLVDGIARMCNIEPARVVRTLRIRRQDLIIYLDDESVRELPEGQDMAAQFHVIQGNRQEREQEAGDRGEEETDGAVGFIGASSIANPPVYELWLMF